MIVPSDSSGLSDLTRVNGLNGRVGLVSADNWGVGRFRSENKEYVTTFGVDGVVAVVGGVAVVDDGVAAVGDAAASDAVGVVDAADADDADDVVDVVNAVNAVDDVVDFDDNSGKLVYYDDFDNSFDIDAPVGSYSLLAYDVQEQVLLWLCQGVGMLGGLGGWNSSLAGNSHELGKHLVLSIFVSGLGFGEKGSGLDAPLTRLDLYHKADRGQNEPFAVDGGYLVVVLELLDVDEDID